MVLTDTLSTLTDYVPGSLWASTGSWGYASGVITWTGTLPAGGAVLVSYNAVISEAVTGPQVVANEALLDDPFGPPQAIRASHWSTPSSGFSRGLVSDRTEFLTVSQYHDFLAQLFVLP